MTKAEKVAAFLKVVDQVANCSISRTATGPKNPGNGYVPLDSSEVTAEIHCKKYFGFTFPLEDDRTVEIGTTTVKITDNDPA